jgi:hypothetical protein
MKCTSIERIDECPRNATRNAYENENENQGWGEKKTRADTTIAENEN